jgi:hypothetical protein
MTRRRASKRSRAEEVERPEAEAVFVLELALDEDDVAEVEERRRGGLSVSGGGWRERSEQAGRFRLCRRH